MLGTSEFGLSDSDVTCEVEISRASNSVEQADHKLCILLFNLLWRFIHKEEKERRTKFSWQRKEPCNSPLPPSILCEWPAKWFPTGGWRIILTVPWQERQRGRFHDLERSLRCTAPPSNITSDWRNLQVGPFSGCCSADSQTDDRAKNKQFITWGFFQSLNITDIVPSKCKRKVHFTLLWSQLCTIGDLQ